jgi:hypothetical protein
MKALRSTVLSLLICVTSSSLISRAAVAQDDATVEAARARFKEGVEYFDNKEYERARLAFVQAYALKAHPAVLLNLAQSELRSGHEADAAAHFSRYLREHGEATEEQRAAARDGLEQAKTVVGVVTLTVDESGAEVLVDGVAAGRTPLDDPLYLSPGEHTIVAQKGSETVKSTLIVEAGSSKSESLSLRGEPEQAAAAAVAPKADEKEPEEEPEEAVEPESDEPDSEGGPWQVSPTVAWIGVGLSAAALGTGAILAVSSKNYYDSADEVAADITTEAGNRGIPTKGICNQPWGTQPPSNQNPPLWVYPDPGFKKACNKYQDRVDSADKYKKYSTIGFIAGGVLAVGTAVYVLVPMLSGGDESAQRKRQKGERFSAQLVPIIAPGQSGLIVQGSF